MVDPHTGAGSGCDTADSCVHADDCPLRHNCGEPNGLAEFEAWLRDELRDAGCEIRTLSPEGMAVVTVRRMREQGWHVTPPGTTDD